MEKFCALCAKTYPGEIVECPVCGRLLQHPEPAEPGLVIPSAEKIADLSREQLEAVAVKLGVKFRANTGTKKLASRVLDQIALNEA